MHEILNIPAQDRSIKAIGNIDLFESRKTGLLCSRKCPADKILEAYETFKSWASDPESTVISGFHSPVEKECLQVLLRGVCNIIFCPAREIAQMRIPKELQPALKANRLLIISPFNEKRASKQTVDQRNIMVADLAAKLYVPYASPNGNLPKILRSPHRP